MALGVLLTPPLIQFFGNDGKPAVNGTVLTQVASVNTATYLDSGLTTPLPNPIPLNSRGEISTANGVSAQCFLTPNVVYTFTLFDSAGNQVWAAPYVNGVQQIPLTQSAIGAILYPQTAAEAAASVTPTNYANPPGVVDRYGTNTIPGTTDMGPAQNAAIAQMLRGGAPVRFLGGAYNIATAPAFGSVTTAMVPIDIGGIGNATQLINNCAAGTAASYDMNGRDGWYIHDLLITGNSANKNDGIHCGHTGGAEQILWRVERVTAFMAGVGFLVADTNGGVINQCRSWVNNPPVFPVPQTVNPSDVGHHFYLTGGFVNNVSLYDCIGLPSHNFFGSTNLQRGIKMDCASSFGVNIIGGDFETYQGGAPYEVGIDIIPSGSCQALTLTGVYYEGTTIQLANTVNSNIGPLADGNVPNTSFILGAACRNNTITGVTAALINDSSTQNYGNTFIACNARTTWTDNSTGPVDRRISCLLSGALIRDWGGTDPVSVTIPAASANQTPNCFTSGFYRYVENASSIAFLVNAPLNPVPGFVLVIHWANLSGGAGVALTFNAIFHLTGGTNTPAIPATGNQVAYAFRFNGTNWMQEYVFAASVPT